MAHVGHNVLTNYLNFRFNRVMTTRQHKWYYHYDQTKIVVECSFDKIKDIRDMAYIEHLAFSMVNDVHYKYPICAVVGPVRDDEAIALGLDKLKLYKG